MAIDFEGLGHHSLNKHETKIVATNVPEGLIVHTGLGVSESAEGPSINESQREKLTGKNLRVVPASEVGLEWRDENGKRMKETGRWAERFYVWVSDKE